jgi:alpha-L-fucosidase 2
VKVYFEQPAEIWTDALPLGNGRLGAMCFGGTARDRIQVNDDTCWSGNPTTAYGPAHIGPRNGEGPALLESVRAAVEADEFGLAESLSQKLQSGHSQSYQPFVDLWISDETVDSAPLDYSRELDLRTGIAVHAWSDPSAQWRQETFTSYPDQALVIGREGDGVAHDFTVRLTTPLNGAIENRDRDGISLVVRMPRLVLPPHACSAEPIKESAEPGDSITAVARLEVRTDGMVEGDHVRGATWLKLILTSETDYAGPTAPLSGDSSALLTAAAERATGLAAVDFGELRRRHVEDHKEKMARAELQLEPGAGADLPTDQRVEAAVNSADPALVALIYEYGRYLLLASSRPGSLPPHLQGIWNEKPHPPWSSNYTTNINLEMNYWGAESGALPECTEPLIRFVEALAERGRRTARELYGLPGWVAHHNSDSWGFSPPAGYGSGDPAWSMWALAGTWLTRPLWERWEFGGDMELLRERIWPVMRGAAEFVAGWVIGGDAMRTAPSTSPENHFIAPDGMTRSITSSTTADLAMIRDLFTNCLRAADVLGIDDELCGQLRDALAGVPRERVLEDGRIAEWARNFPDAEPHHRHQSHLYGVMPGESVIADRDVDLASAARATLDARGSRSTGWSLAWRVALRARLLDGDAALRDLKQFLLPVPRGASDAPSMSAPSGIYRNLFCAHPPFQIDGNLAISAAIGEMLVQSHGGTLRLLPALPREWSSGSIRGHRARHGLTVDLAWMDGALVLATVSASRPYAGTVRHDGFEAELVLSAGEVVRLTSEHFQRN